MLHRTLVVKRGLHCKLYIYRFIYIPILTYGHQTLGRVPKQRDTMQLQAAEISFRQRIRDLLTLIG